MSDKTAAADSRPPTYAMVTRVYRSSLRPVVVLTALITAGWTLISGIGAFEEINVDKDHGFPKFATIAIALGSLYMTVVAIELFGVTAAVMNSLLFIKIYSYFSVLSGLIVVGAALLRVVVHFIYKDDLIKECEQLAEGQDILIRFGLWGPTIRDKLDAQEAADFCNHWWGRDSSGEIVSLIVLIILSGFFIAIAFAFVHQVNDPAFQRSRAMPTRANDFPEHYNPPYVSYDPSVPVRYDPPPGPPPPANAFQGTGYGAGMGKADSNEDLKGDDPFADFDEPSHRHKAADSRDNLV